MNLKKDCGCNKKQPKVEIPLKQFNKDPFEDLCGKDFDSWKAPVDPDCNYVDKRVHIDNHPDEEDLTEVISGEELVLKFKDKLYNPAAFSGMGRVFLRKNMVSKTLNCFTDQRNVLTNDMFLDDFGRPLDNTIFIVQYDYDLDNKFIIMPKDCILLFLGGSFSNGTLVLNNTLFLPQILDYDTFINCNVKGTFRTGQVFYHCNKISFFDGKDWLTLGTTQQKDIESLLADLQAQIDEIKAQLGGGYATKEELNALETNLQRQIDSINSKLPVDYIQDVVAGSGIQVTKNGKTVTITNTGGSGLNYAITDFSVNNNKLHLKQNNGIDQTVTLPTGGGGNTGGLNESDITYTNEVLNNASGRYLAGTLHVGTTDISIYGHDVVGSGGGDSSKSSYYEMVFLGTDVEIAPKAPVDYVALADTYVPRSGEGIWSHGAPNKPYLWMCQRFIDGDILGVWNEVVRLGNAGADDGKYEYIYCKSSSNDVDTLPSKDSTSPSEESSDKGSYSPSDPDFIPSGWKDNPQGVDEIYRYEWMSYRQRIITEVDGSYQTTFTNFSIPVIMSAYGVRGIDGDGVEYIFCKNFIAPSNTNAKDYPNNWYTNEQSKNGATGYNGKAYNSDEYIDPSGYSINTNVWTDEPVSMDAPGDEMYVSIRKKRTDSNDSSSELPQAYWHQYSEPKLWSKLAQNIASAGALIFDEMMLGIPVNAQGNNSAYSKTIKAHIYEGEGTARTVTAIRQGSPFITVGNAVSAATDLSDNSGVSINIEGIQGEEQYITISFAENAISNFAQKSYTLHFVGDSSSISNRVGTIQIMGINTGSNGQDGVGYDLVTDVQIIKKDINDGGLLPENIIPGIVKTSGGNSVESYVNLNDTIPANLRITWTSDLGQTGTITNSISAISLKDSSDNWIVDEYININLQYNDNGAWKTIDWTRIWVITDGINGLSASTYTLSPISSTLTNNNGTLTGQVQFKAYKRYNMGTQILTKQSGDLPQFSDGEYGKINISITGYVGVIDNVEYQGEIGTWTLSESKSGNYKYVVAELQVGPSSSNLTTVTSVVIPILQGNSSEAQTLKQSYLVEYPIDWSGSNVLSQRIDSIYNGSVAVDGKYPQHFIKYNPTETPKDWGIYVCIDSVVSPITVGSIPSDTTHFSRLDWEWGAYFNILIANNAYINSLSSQQVVLVNESGEVVGGMTSGEYIPVIENGQVKHDSEGNVINSTIPSNGIRIWAGSTEANIANAPFTVNSDGHLKAKDAEIKGDVVADSFQTGESNENGIVVLASAQDSFFNNSTSGNGYALHNKAYFYHDGNSMNLAIYNDEESKWYKLDFSSLQQINSTGGNYIPKTYFTINYNGGYVNTILKNILYLNTADNKYYSEPNSSGGLVTGTYYKMNGGTNNGYIYTDATTTVNVTEYTCVAFSNGEVVTGPSAPIGGPFYIGTIGGSSRNFVATGLSVIIDNETVYTGTPQTGSGYDMQPAGNITWFSNSGTITKP